MPRLRVVLLAWFGLFLIAAEGAVKGPPPPAPPGAKDEAAERVARLIALLGSPTFGERERATQALETVGVPALAALREAARKADPEVRRRAGELVERIENSLEALAITYREYGLPVPSAETPLILYPDPYGAKESYLCILLRPGDRQAPPELLQGFLRFSYNPWSKVEGTPLNPSILSDKEIEALLRRIKLWQGQALALAIQCKARGWDVLAHRLFNLPRDRADRGSPPKVLLKACWEFWWTELSKPKSDWTAVRKRLRALHAADKELDTEENRKLLTSLDAALVPSKARPGSTEALIDDLMQAQYDHWKSDDRTGPLVEKGFAAVPQLINHLGDNRLTRYLWGQGGITGVPLAPFYYRVRDLAGEALGRISAGHVGQESSRAEVEEWWASARKVGEEEYWVDHALPDNSLPENTAQPDWDLVPFIGKKYPRRLAELYRKVLEDRSELSSDPLAEAIGKSALPRQRKAALLAPAARHKIASHRRAALWALNDAAPDLAAARLIESLETLPPVTQQFTDLGPDEAAFAYLVPRSADPRVWKALEKAARRSGVGLRFEYLEGVVRGGAEGPQRKQTLAFLAAFLDDTCVRDVKRDIKWRTSCAAANEFPRMEVRNFAALSIARMLQLEDAPKPTWGEAEWAELRRKVREALRQAP